MLTRCPQCETHFRVTPEQLRARKGKVRCGACQSVFNALDSLCDEPVAEDSPAPLTPLAVEDILAEATASAPDAFRAANDEVLETLTPEAVPQDEVIAPESEARTQADPSEPAQTIATMPAEEATSTASGVVHVTDAEATEKSRCSEDGDELPPVEAAITTGEANSAVASTATGESPPIAPELSEVPATSDTSPAPDVPKDLADLVAPADPEDHWDRVPERAAPRRWTWVLGSVLLLVTASLQLAFAFRVELAVLTPGLRPALSGVSALIGATVPYPRKPELIGIEASDLAPAGTDRLLLTATVKNRAPFDQEFPALELTLTDTQDAALVRKVLAPADYLPADHPPQAAFAAQEEVAVHLTLETPGVPAAGYRLYLFYP
jgi:predicted Zn finger-like uncharacterized protein